MTVEQSLSDAKRRCNVALGERMTGVAREQVSGAIRNITTAEALYSGEQVDPPGDRPPFVPNDDSTYNDRTMSRLRLIWGELSEREQRAWTAWVIDNRDGTVGDDPEIDPPSDGRPVVGDPSTIGDAVVTGEFHPGYVDHSYEDVLFQGGYRSCFFTGHHNDHTLYSSSLRRCTLQAGAEGGPAIDGMPSKRILWVSRQHGLHSCEYHQITAENIFGDGGNIGTAREGHVWYLSLSTDELSDYNFSQNVIRNCGGHGGQFVTGIPWHGDRVGNTKLPRPGGKFSIKDSLFENTDICRSRGSFSLGWHDTKLGITLERVTVTQNDPRYGQSQYGIQGNSRAAVVTRDGHPIGEETGGFYAYNSKFNCEPPFVNMKNQLDFKGVKEVIMEGSEVLHGNVAINDPWHLDPTRCQTRRYKFKDCTGNAKVWINGAFIGMISDNLEGRINGS